MPIGTEFEVIFDGEKIENNTMIIYRSLHDKATKHIDWVCHPQDTFMQPYDFLINGVFIPIQQPVSFMEAIEAYSKGKTIKSIEKEDGQIFTYIYIPDDIADCIEDDTHCAMTAREILNAKWYIEESEADSNE